MRYCEKCGKALNDGMKYCGECGAPISRTSNQRSVKFEGGVYKCPNCGEILDSFISRCPACGYELRHGRSSDSIQLFSEKLASVETEVQKINLIRGYPVPNTREDILEFMFLACSNFDANYYIAHLDEEDVSDAWLSKIDQCYQKGRLVLNDEYDLHEINRLHDAVYQDILTHKKKRHNESVLMVILKNVAVWIGLILNVIAVFFMDGGDEAKLLEAIAYVILIASACTLPKREATITDYCIGAISGFVSLGLSFFLWDGSVGKLCGGTVLVIIAINLFKGIRHNHTS